MASTASPDKYSPEIPGLRAADPLVHDFARRLGTVDFDSIEGHLRLLEQRADAGQFLCLDEPAAAAVSEPTAAADGPSDTARELGEIGPYRLARLLGVGGFSRVYEAFHRDRPAERVALKLFQHRWLDALERLEIERLVLQELRHPNLVQAIDSGETQDGLSYLVLAFVSGQRIDEFVRSRKLAPREIAELFALLADALAYAHGQDVIHRDLKPNNILVSDERIPVVADFGLAKRLRLPRGQSVTVSGALIGTLGYLAPEQVHGGRGEITRAVDIYGLGATLYAVLTGRPPTESENLLRGLHQLQHGRPPAPRSLNPNVPLELQLICLKCLEKLPRDRYGSMEELAADLRRYVSGQRVTARAPSIGTQLVRWAVANPKISSLVAGIVAAVTLGLVGSLIFWQRAEVRRVQADNLLRSAHSILSVGNRMAENSLAQTAGSLEYRYNRLKQSVVFLSDLVEQSPADLGLKRELATTYFRLAKVCSRRNVFEESEEKFTLARDLFVSLAEKQPDDVTLKFDVFHSYLGHHHVKATIDEAGYSNELLWQAHELIQRILVIEPGNTKYRDAHINTMLQLAGRMLGMNPEAALRLKQQAHAESLKLREELPEPCLEWRYAGLTAAGIAGCLRKLERYDEAIVWIERAREYQKEYEERASRDPLEKIDGIWMLYEKVELYLKRGELQRAQEIYKEALQINLDYIEAYPDYIDFQRYFDSLRDLPKEYPELLTSPEILPEQTADWDF